MPNVAEIIKDHVTLEVRCIDRLYLKTYIPRLQTSGGVIDFLVRACRQQIASPAVVGQLTDAFKAGLRRWATEHQIPWIAFRKGERKDTVVQRYRDRFRKPSGVVVIGVAQERASAGPPRSSATAYPVKICLNGHEWAKRQLQRQRLRFTALDNGFLHCAKPEVRQTICDTRSAADIDAFFTRWQAQIPFPLLPVHHAHGFTYQLSLLQLEVSLTQVFDRPLRGRAFFESVIRENLDLGRPNQVQLLFPERSPARRRGASRRASLPTASTPVSTSPTSAATSSSTSRRSARCAPSPPSTRPTISALEGGCRT